MGLWKSPRAERYRGRMRVLWKDKWHWVSEVWWRRVSLLWAQKPTWKTRARWDSWTLAFIKFLNCIVIFMYERCMCVIAHLWRPKDNLHMLVLTFHLVGPKFSCRHIYLLSPLVSPVKLVYMHRGMRVFMYISLHVWMYLYVYTCACVHICVWMYVSMCMSVCIRVCICTCICVCANACFLDNFGITKRATAFLYFLNNHIFIVCVTFQYLYIMQCWSQGKRAYR